MRGDDAGTLHDPPPVPTPELPDAQPPDDPRIAILAGRILAEWHRVRRGDYATVAATVALAWMHEDEQRLATAGRVIAAVRGAPAPAAPAAPAMPSAPPSDE